ncbi:MAG: hypothetical protein IRY98_11055 [Alicyclobacillaceae bacterium]|nr:hypothetical protein [Alicyclobacillaceae bacterium]
MVGREVRLTNNHGEQVLCMPIANCARCGRVFNRVARNICPGCIAEEEKAFQQIREYLRTHPLANVEQIAEGTGVDVSVVIDLLESGRLSLREPYPCERCGEPITSGRYCPRCTRTLQDSLSAASRSLVEKPETYVPLKIRRNKQWIDF